MKTAYLAHLLLWMGPVVAGQWIIAGRILARNWKAVVAPTLILGTYLCAADSYAIGAGIWFFDPAQNLGITIGPYLPLEEALFFYLTSLLVAQSLVMFLPNRLRRS
jgi:lycopene cyclase domain-containing protein